MSAAKQKNVNSRCVFVGNIPYDASEKEIIAVFEKVGRVVSFRLVTDRDTGKPKGYGFCEFEDKQIAHCAIRNLNNVQLYGRSLRVDHATAETNNINEGKADSEDIKGSYCVVQPSIEKPTLSEETVRVVKAMGMEEKGEILANIKEMAARDPAAAKSLLAENPQLRQALLAIMIVFEIVTTEEIQQLQNESIKRQQLESNRLSQNSAPDAVPTAPVPTEAPSVINHPRPVIYAQPQPQQTVRNPSNGSLDSQNSQNSQNQQEIRNIRAQQDQHRMQRAQNPQTLPGMANYPQVLNYSGSFYPQATPGHPFYPRAPPNFAQNPHPQPFQYQPNFQSTEYPVDQRTRPNFGQPNGALKHNSFGQPTEEFLPPNQSSNDGRNRSRTFRSAREFETHRSKAVVPPPETLHAGGRKPEAEAIAQKHQEMFLKLQQGAPQPQNPPKDAVFSKGHNRGKKESDKNTDFETRRGQSVNQKCAQDSQRPVQSGPQTEMPQGEEILKKLPQNQQQVLKKLLALGPAEVEKLPESIRQKVTALKTKMAGKKRRL